MKWLSLEAEKDKVKDLSGALNISEFLASLLVQRGFRDPITTQKFLYPSLQSLENPYEILNVKTGVDRLEHAAHAKERIAIVGDYDVDGITSLALLARCFKFFNLTFKYFVPHRETEGYGLTQGLLERVNRQGNFSLFFTLDCGTNSAKLIRQMRDRGQGVIVIDHHQPQEEVPDCILINPHVWPQNHSVSAQQLCTVGLVFKFMHAWLKCLRDNGNKRALEFKLKPLLDLVALGTVADMVPLKNENRIFVYYGLKQLRNSIIPGIKALIKTSYSEPEPDITVEDISFKLAPRINASGRLSSAELPLELLLEEDFSKCLDWAVQLDELNQDRQNLEKAIGIEAESLIKLKPFDDKLWILYNPSWHIGVVGIVAGKLARKYNKPVVVLGQQGAFAKGSGRGIEAINLVELFEKGANFLHQWGGHPSAIGVTLLPQDVPLIEDHLNRYLLEKFPLGLPEKTLNLSGRFNLSDLTATLVEEVETLQPFGQGNPAPIFCVSKVQLPKAVECFGANRAHIRCSLTTPSPIGIIGWGLGEGLKENTLHQQKIDMAVKVSWNTWKQARQLQLQLIDWKCSE